MGDSIYSHTPTPGKQAVVEAGCTSVLLAARKNHNNDVEVRIHANDALENIAGATADTTETVPEAPASTRVVEQRPEHLLQPEPLRSDSHLLLSISKEGMRSFCERIGFPILGSQNEQYAGNDDYRGTYVRDELVDGWITAAFGPQDRAAKGENLTGYDLGAAIRSWLAQTGNEHRSVCEVLLAEGAASGEPAVDFVLDLDGKHPRLQKHVRLGPTVFYSHMQSKPLWQTFMCMGRATESFNLLDPLEQGARPRDGLVEATNFMHRALNEPVYWWIDYFTLRQCQRDFDVRLIRMVIQRIGRTVVELHTYCREYLARSFCVFEAFATVESGSALLCQLAVSAAQTAAEDLKKQHVDSRAAVTWRSEDKMQIDAFIESLEGGFARLDACVTDAVLEGARSTIVRHRKIDPQSDPAAFGLRGMTPVEARNSRRIRSEAMADAREDLLELYRSAPVTAPVAEEVPPRIRGLPMSMTRVFEDPLKTEARWGRRPGQRQAGGGFGGESVEWLP
jgi:hypothetical protein